MMVKLRRMLARPTRAGWQTHYATYLQSPAWSLKRQAVLERTGHRCERCGQGGPLHIHHLTYAHVFAERLDELQAVCPECHEVADVERRSRIDDERRLRRRRQARRRKQAPAW